MKPVIKWVGGKRQLLDEIRKRVPDNFNCYYEPFIGGGALLCDLEPDKAVINDYNEELTNLYKIIKKSPRKLITLLEYHKANNNSDYYYKLRNIDRTNQYNELSNIEKAARLIYLNKVCFNGLYRVNSKGEFNVPYGKYVNPTIYSEDDILAFHNYLKQHNVAILTGDFTKAISKASSGDFVYFDPPYAPLSATSSFTSYSDVGFSANDQVRLKHTCDKLNNKGIKFLLSNSNCDFIKELYKDYIIEFVDAKRSINSKGSGRGKIKEVLVRNYE